MSCTAIKMQMYSVLQKTGVNKVVQVRRFVETKKGKIAVLFFWQKTDPNYFDTGGRETYESGIDKSEAEGTTVAALLWQRTWETTVVTESVQYGTVAAL